VSRSSKPPSGIDLGIRVNMFVLPAPAPGGLPLMFGFVGNPNYESQHLLNTEAGYRFEFKQEASVEIAVFHGRYSHLKTSEPIAPVFEFAPGPPHLFIATQYQNLLQADTTGVEVNARWMPFEIWRVDGSFSGFHLTPHLDPASQDPLAGITTGQAPARQWQLHSWLAAGARTEINLAVYRVGDVLAPASGETAMSTTPAYTRADANVTVRLSDRLSAVVTGQNLFDTSHVEFAGYGIETTSIPRTIAVQTIWKF
jgi:outer membrane receptor protein involved in Fe transport